MEKNIELFKTKDLFSATYILSSGQTEFYGLETLEDGRTKLFLFTPYEIAQKLENEYYAGGSRAAKLLFLSYKELRTQLFGKGEVR